jgi:low density lipoprotein receptor-related protein 5/6
LSDVDVVSGLGVDRLSLALVAPLVVVLSLFVAPGLARASEMLDQSQTDTSAGEFIVTGPDNSNPESLAQTFTAGVTGRLDRVDLYLRNDFSETAPLTVEIRDTSGGAPGSTVLASASLAAARVPSGGGWVKVGFASPALVAGGVQYAIVAYTGDIGTQDDYGWDFSASDPYGGGALWASSATPPTTWAPVGSNPSPDDLAFKAYVAVPAGARIYWGNSNGNTIGFANLDGGGGGLLNTSRVTPNQPDGLAIDSPTGRLYWGNPGSNTISFASLAGSAGGNLTAPGATFSASGGVAINPATRMIYWANTNSIGYARLGGGGGKLNTHGAVVDQPNDVAIDTANGRLYWTNSGNNTIYSAKLNNTGAGQRLNTGSASVSDLNGLAIDVSTGKLYWANGDDNTHPIGWAKTNNSGAANLPTSGATADGAFGLALDHTAGRLYWGNFFNNTISFANLSGSGGGQLATTGTTPDGPGYPILLKKPLPTTAPKLRGGSTVGAKLSCSRGIWASDVIGAFVYRQPKSFSYNWRRNGKPIVGATKQSITASRTGTYDCTVTAQNEAGSTKSPSAPHKVT